MTTTTTKRVAPSAPEPESLRARAAKLGLWGLIANWERMSREPWIEELIGYEEAERARRSLQRRTGNAKLGRFKPMCDFDWKWPKKIDHELLEDILSLRFLEDSANVVLVGPNGVGKTMIAKNVAHQAILRGFTARFTTASALLNDLASQDSASGLERRLRFYSRPQLLVLDEVGYLSTSAEHADLLFEVVTRRYQERSIVLTTNKPFSEWREVFPSSGVVVTLIDRLVHRAEIIEIVAESYRLKESRERAESREKERKTRRVKEDAKGKSQEARSRRADRR